jgi:hypothetical protein
MEDDNKDKEEQEGAVQPAAQEESGVTRNQWDGGPWPQEAASVATDEDNHRMLEATRNRPENLTQTQTPDSHWDSVLSRQHAQDVEDVKLQRFAQNRAVVEQMIKARDDRVNAEKAAVQAREDEFSALASLCYDPAYGQAFVDSGTLQAYNAAHQGEQGFNPITKMGRMTGGALFVERQVVDNNGRPVVEQFVDPKTGRTVRRPKIAVEAIGPKQFQARMQDFRDWQWDDVTKQFMNRGDFAKVQKSREDKARAEMIANARANNPALDIKYREQENKERETSIKEAETLAKIATEAGNGGGRATKELRDEDDWLTEKIDALSGKENMTDSEKRDLEHFTRRRSKIRAEIDGQEEEQDTQVKLGPLPYSDSLADSGWSDNEISDVLSAYKIMKSPQGSLGKNEAKLRAAAPRVIEKYEKGLTPAQLRRVRAWMNGGKPAPEPQPAPQVGTKPNARAVHEGAVKREGTEKNKRTHN